MGDLVRDAKYLDMNKLCVLNKGNKEEMVDEVDICVTEFSDKAGLAIALVNKSADNFSEVRFEFEAMGEVIGYFISGNSTSSYNDINHTEIEIQEECLGEFKKGMKIMLRPHSVEIIQIGCL